MPVTMSGMSSGMNTDAIVEKLVNVEARPIKQLEIRKRNHNNRKETLKILSKHLDEVNNASRDLFGFRTSFNDKKAVSSDNSVIEAKATNLADKGVKKIKVIQTASSHTISTDPLQEKETLPAGKFTIEVDGTKHTIAFKGGSLKSLREKIEETASDLVSTSYVRKDGDRYILTIESKKSGEKGEIKLTGDAELLAKTGLVTGEKNGKSDDTAISFDDRYFTSYMGDKKTDAETGAVKVGNNGKSVRVEGLVWREYALPLEVSVKEDTIFEFNLGYREQKEAAEDDVPQRLKIGPKEQINIKGIILDGYNVVRNREGKQEAVKGYDSLLGIGLVSIVNGKRVEKIYPLGKDLQGVQKISAGRDFKNGTISKIIVYCNHGAMDIADVKLATPQENKNWFAGKNVVSQPRDAKLTVDGIELTRDRNNDLADIIKGVTLTIKRPSQHEIDLNIEHTVDASIDKIKRFVEAYNKYLDFHREITKAAMGVKPGEFEKTLSQSGIFVSDMTLVRLEGLLKMTVNGAYPNSADKPIKLLTQLGISTGAINADWETIKNGRLIMNEAEVRKVISENPDGVAAFFGSDGDGDGKPDNGMAVKVSSVLRPYVNPGKNIIAAKMELEDNSIKIADENIKQKEDHLKKYEEKLKRKFASMEQSINQSNSQKQWMKYQMGETDKGGGQKD